MKNSLLPRFRATVCATTAFAAVLASSSVALAQDDSTQPNSSRTSSPQSSSTSPTGSLGSAPALSLNTDTPQRSIASRSSQSSSSSPLTGGRVVEFPGKRPEAKPATIKLDNKTPGYSDDDDFRKLAKEHENIIEVTARSEAMEIDVPLLVLRPKDPAKRDNAPTLYALNGLDAGTGWFRNTDAIKFYGERNVNVVMPVTGAFTYYTDWRKGEGTNPRFAKQQWETFLTRELPNPLEDALKASKKRAILGVSMSATSALLAAQHNPGVYDAVASVSGCASTTGRLGRKVVDTVLERREDGATANDMWGEVHSEFAKYNDPYLNARKLSPQYQGRDMKLYISSATGLAGKDDLTLTNPLAPGNKDFAVNLVRSGGPIDIGANLCTHALNNRLRVLGIPVTSKFYPTGTHQWGVFRRTLEDSWPTLQKALFRN